MPRNAFYAQSGGVTSVINASACGVIQTARQHPDKISNVLAGRNGIIGALVEDLIDTSLESEADIAALRHTPAGALFLSVQIEKSEANRAEYERLIEVPSSRYGYFFITVEGFADTCFGFALSQTLDFLCKPSMFQDHR